MPREQLAVQAIYPKSESTAGQPQRHRRYRNNTAEPKLAQIEFIHKDINDPNGIVLIKPVFQAFTRG